MRKETSGLVTRILAVIGILCFLAMAFQLVPANYATFAGCACFVIAGSVRAFASRNV